MPLTQVPSSLVQDSAITGPKLATGVAGKVPAFSAYAASSQTGLTSGAYTKVTLGTEDYDTDGCYNTATSRFQPTVAGYYQVNGTVYGTATTLSSVVTKIYKNGTGYKLGQIAAAVGSASAVSSVSTIVYLNGTTDYVELYAAVTGASGMQIAYGGDASTTSHFSAALVRLP